MRSDVMSVNDAAGVLGVSPVRVRQLVQDDVLPSERIGRSILLPASAVRARAADAPPPGRPFGADMAWALLRCLDRSAAAELSANAVHVVIREVLDRRLRHRVKQVLSIPRSVDGWARLLGPRARRRRFWIHQGVIDGLLSDRRVHPGRARAAASHGIAISAAGDLCVYVAEQNLPGLISEFQLEPDDEQGNLLVYVVAEGASQWLPAPSEPVGASAAAADMLDSDDARMRHVGAQWIARSSSRIPSQA